MLEDLEPLVYDIDDILRDDILDLACAKGLEEMPFDPSALRRAVRSKSKEPQVSASDQKKGKKRPWVYTTDVLPWGSRESSSSRLRASSPLPQQRQGILPDQLRGLHSHFILG
ncbi:uncharacterized protein LOC111376003 [Olea europaea var. sylvestris]|uniref:uncharacterized protein LOC111376003 n=1 Tax=Olea europaea var. sylvestris TaxID=158386 RepID=UPI000C1D0EAF|nr:uncharacterized protein LOC111376003 [Olea europaea var. sylvestris]